MNFNIQPISEETINPFMILEKFYEITFSTSDLSFQQAYLLIESTITNLVNNLKEKMKRKDKISLNIFHSQFNIPVTIPFVLKKDFTPELVFDALSNVTQSYKDALVNINNNLIAKAQIQTLPQGEGRRALPDSEKKPKYIKKIKPIIAAPKPSLPIVEKRIEKPRTRIKTLKRKQKLYVKKTDRKHTFIQNNLRETKIYNINSVLPVINKDRSCLLRAILIAKSIVDYKKYNAKKRFKKINYKNRQFAYISKSMLDKQVKVIRKKLNLKNKACGIDELQRIEMYLKKYSITLINGQDSSYTNKILYSGPTNTNFIYIIYTNSHYDVIPSMKLFFKSKGYCNYCKLAYFKKHRCPKMCKSCLRLDCLEIDNSSCYKCTKCNVKSRNIECLRDHSENVCASKTLCEECGLVFTTKHVCVNQKYCSNCEKIVEESHECFLAPDKYPIKPKKNYCFFDYETMLIKGKHIPNFICAKYVCYDCLEKEDHKDAQSSLNDNCEECETRFFSKNSDFGDWLFTKKKTICIAHNMRSFDGILMLEYILQIMNSVDKMPKVLLNGSKIISMEFRNLKFIDSLSFLPMALDKFTKTFDIKELKKGYFPHKFNLPKNQNYIGPMPDKKYYDVDNMSESKLKDFEVFYAENKDKEFNFQKEIKSYCESDVDLLKTGCLSFRKIIKDLTKNEKFEDGIDPFLCSVTIASLSNFIFRNIMLKENQIGIIPENGYHANQKHSIGSIEWLNYMSYSKGIDIKHARNNGEQRINDYVVDGFHPETNTIFEFHGCLYHSCKLCYDQSSFNKTKQMSMRAVRVLHDKRMKILKNSTFNGQKVKVISIWECDWNRQKLADPDVKDFLEDNPVIDRLLPREAFYGARTEVFKIHTEAASHQQIKYQDYCSLYPFIMKNRDLPLGHATIITSDFKKTIDDYFGIIKLKILPPQDLYIPVLPVRSNGRLLFPLCGKCAANRSEKCNHNEDQRALIGSWCTEEVKVAIKHNYKIIEIYEVWHFENKSNLLFKEYIDTFLKGKQTASGFPEGCDTEVDKLKYIQDYFENEGIRLDINEIFYSSGWRAINKLLLNSLWGKLAQKYNKMRFKIITDPKEWFQLISNDAFIVHRVDFSNKKYLQVYYTNRDELNKCHSKNNIVLALFITAYGRLKLYEQMCKLGPRLIYTDTDCYFYWTEPGLYEPKTGNYLGQLTNEITKDKGNHIVEMVALAEKCYSYITDTGYSHALCKGIAFNHLTSLKINFESLKEMAVVDTSKEIAVNQRYFTINNKKWTINTETRSKVLKNTFNKRIILENKVDTIPYGFKLTRKC